MFFLFCLNYSQFVFPLSSGKKLKNMREIRDLKKNKSYLQGAPQGGNFRVTSQLPLYHFWNFLQSYLFFNFYFNYEVEAESNNTFVSQLSGTVFYFPHHHTPTQNGMKGIIFIEKKNMSVRVSNNLKTIYRICMKHIL